ncbi:MAG: hypothetical protein J6W43_08260 [Prevotella sp.]|nr:hypothetical protein [Prevotella sp.]
MTTYIERLRVSAEQKVGRQMHTPKDFDYLRECIYEECHEMVSLSTLKRLWGYDRYEGTPRISTLVPIARYVGFRDWDDFLQHQSNVEEEDSQDESTASIQETIREEPTRRIGIYVLAALLLLIVVVGGVLLWSHGLSVEKVDAVAVEEPLPPSGKRVLRKGQDCFRTIEDYLALFGIEAVDTAYFRPLPDHKYVYLWGPEYLHPVWHNEGDTTQLMPTITEYWTPLPGAVDYQNKEYVRLANEKLYYERLEKDELRLTFMKNIVDGFYIFLGIYRMDKENSTIEKTVWKRVADQCDMGHLDKIELLRNH